VFADGKYMSADPARGRNAQASLSPLLQQSSQLGNKSEGDIATMTNKTPRNPGTRNRVYVRMYSYTCVQSVEYTLGMLRIKESLIM
jgi:hypothetical protein